MNISKNNRYLTYSFQKIMPTSKSFRIASTLLVSAGMLFSAVLPSIAAPFKDAAGSVHIQDGLTATQKVTLELTGTPLSKKVTVTPCGLATIGAPSSTLAMPGSISVAGNSIDTTSLPIAGTPKCTLNTTTGVYGLATPVTGNFKTTSGQVVLINQTAGSQLTVEYTGINKTKIVTANACGLIKTGSAASPAPATFKYEGTDYTTASLPIAVPARCINGIKYVPVI
jgi:hypothetical protein